MIRSHCCLCVTLDMLLLFPEPQSSQLYNGRVRENQRDMRTETGEVGGGEWTENLRDPQMEAETLFILGERKWKGAVRLCNLMGCSLSGSSVHGILQARKLEWVALPFPRGSS